MNIDTEKTTQAVLADQIGVSQSHVSRVLRGEAKPSLKVAEKLAALRGVHVLHVMAPDRYDEDGSPRG